ncbi:MAG: hypothetical protein KDC98_05455 [Planctomycetes bacterium]|nr:hypothetical protein [Planctomycetota bacterium]
MGEDGVRRTGSLPALGGFASRPSEEQAPRRRAAQEDEGEPTQVRGSDEVEVRSDAVAAMLLLRERVLAVTRQRLGLGSVHVPAFAEIVEGESIEVFLSRLLSDQNQLVGQASAPRGRQQERTAAFEQGVAESRELLADLGDEARQIVDLVAAEFARRLAALEN